MTKAAQGYENEGTPGDDTTAGSGGHGGTAVQQGMHGHSRRSEARGRDEFQGHGDSAQLDNGRSAEGGRHYGRPAIDEPAPDGGPPGPPPGGAVERPEGAEVDTWEADAPDGGEGPTRTQGRHGEAPFTQGRDAGKREQSMPQDREDVGKGNAGSGKR